MSLKDQAGGCACGAVRYRLDLTADAGYCSCATCRRASGAGAMVWVVGDRTTFRLTGEVATWRSSDHAVRQFCPRCGGQLFLLEDATPALIEIAAGTLDRPAAIAPTHAIWVKDRPDWARPPQAVPEYPADRPEEQPPG